MQKIYTKELSERFIKGDMDEELVGYILGELTERQKGSIYPEDIEHIKHCLKGIVADLFGIYLAGDFGQAIIKNNLFETIALADNTNILFLNIYTKFLYNKIPYKLLKDGKE